MVRSHWVYRKLRNFRAGIEAGISCLKRAYGLVRCTWRGLEHFKAYVWSSVVAYNLASQTLNSVNNLAELYRDQGRYGKAEPLYERALEARERVLGKEHPQTLISVNNLALLYRAQGRYGEAEPLYKRTLEAFQRVLGKEHPYTLTSVNNLALLYFAQSDWARAGQFWRRSTAAIAARTQRGTLDVGQVVTGKKKSEAEQKTARNSGTWSRRYTVLRLKEAPPCE